MQTIITDELFFLPLSPETAALIAGGAHDITSLSIPELTVVLLLNGLPAMDKEGRRAAAFETILAKAIGTARDIDGGAGDGSFAQAVAARHSPPAFVQGLALIEKHNLVLLEEEEVAARDYLTAAGAWDFSFRQRHIGKLNPLLQTVQTGYGKGFQLTDQQFRIYNTLRDQIDEHLHLEGRAGVGKTALICWLLELLDHQQTLLLTYTRQQLNALTSRIKGAKFHAMTFVELASDLLFTSPSVYRKPDRQRTAQTYQVSDADIARMLGLLPVGDLSPERVASIAQRTVQSFCSSGSDSITAENLPHIDTPLSKADTAGLVGYAHLIWQETVQPKILFEGRPTRLHVRGYHLIKMLALDSSITINPNWVKHILVDEAHDLSVPMVQILDRCQQAIYTLGDSIQRLDGIPVRRSQAVRPREITQSVRAGREMEAIVNPLLMAHPRVQLAPLEGARNKKTIIEYYDRVEIPQDGTTILVGSEFGIFEWFQRLATAGARFCLLGTARKEFTTFVNDCIELYRFGSPTRHGLLFKYSTWNALSSAYSTNPSFRAIETLLERGYKSTDFEKSMARLVPPDKATIFLGRVSDVRSMEMDRVMLGRDLLAPVRPGDTDAAARLFSMLYTGSSRARYQLLVPGHLREWIQDQALHAKTRG